MRLSKSRQCRLEACAARRIEDCLGESFVRCVITLVKATTQVKTWKGAKGATEVVPEFFSDYCLTHGLIVWLYSGLKIYNQSAKCDDPWDQKALSPRLDRIHVT